MITKEQAAKIYDLESYKEVTGAKRFKRTKEDMALGLTPEEALQKRLKELKGEPQSNIKGETNTRRHEQNKGSRRSGEIIVRITPSPNVSSEYFEHCPRGEIKLSLDEKWYGWFDTQVSGPYEGNITKLLQDILDRGIGELVTHVHFPADVEQ